MSVCQRERKSGKRVGGEERERAGKTEGQPDTNTAGIDTGTKQDEEEDIDINTEIETETETETETQTKTQTH